MPTKAPKPYYYLLVLASRQRDASIRRACRGDDPRIGLEDDLDQFTMIPMDDIQRQHLGGAS